MTVSKRGTESSSGQQQLTEDEWNELEDPLSEFFDQCATIQEDEVDDAPNAGGAKIPAICDTTRGDSETEKIIRAAHAYSTCKSSRTIRVSNRPLE